MLKSLSRLELAAATAPFLVFLIVYLPAAGHGFILDDFDWVNYSRISSWNDIARILSGHLTFYRPVVALTFAVDAAIFELRPLGYGLTNLALALLCAWLLYALARQLGMPVGASVLASALWLLNVHGISMALLWISGRTSLLLTVFALASALALVRREVVFAGVFLMLALFSKEEAVALPFILAVWLVLEERLSRADRRRVALAWLVASFSALTAYLALRARSGAITFSTAPSFYQLTLAPRMVAANILQYADRAMTWPAVTMLLSLILLRPQLAQVKPSRTLLQFGFAWVLGGYAITVFLPVRSSLYACFPSVGSCLVAGEVCRALWAASSPEPRRRTLVAAIVIPILLIPVYQTRNQRWVGLADFSSTFLAQLVAETRDLPERSHVVLIDPQTARVNIGSALGGHVEVAYSLTTGRSLRFSIVRSDADADLECGGCTTRLLMLNGSNLTRVSASDFR